MSFVHTRPVHRIDGEGKLQGGLVGSVKPRFVEGISRCLCVKRDSAPRLVSGVWGRSRNFVTPIPEPASCFSASHCGFSSGMCKCLYRGRTAAGSFSPEYVSLSRGYRSTGTTFRSMKVNCFCITVHCEISQMGSIASHS